MYFLALVLTLRLRETDSFSCRMEDVEMSSSLFLTGEQTGNDIRVALLDQDRSHVYLRLSCLNMASARLRKVIQHAVAPGSGLRYAEQDCDIESVDVSNVKWTGTASWADMIQGRLGRRMKFTFKTPLFTSPVSGQEGNALPFPDPLTFFTAVQQQWQCLHGPTLPHTGERAVDLAKCMVAEYHLETVKRAFQDGRFTGYLGWIEYTCLSRDEAALISLNALTRLAFFTGAGHLAERGMGVATVSVTN